MSLLFRLLINLGPKAFQNAKLNLFFSLLGPVKTTSRSNRKKKKRCDSNEPTEQGERMKQKRRREKKLLRVPLILSAFQCDALNIPATRNATRNNNVAVSRNAAHCKFHNNHIGTDSHRADVTQIDPVLTLRYEVANFLFFPKPQLCVCVCVLLLLCAWWTCCGVCEFE